MTTLAAAPPTPLPDAALEDWMLQPGITHLNHGCFGARLKSVQHAQHRMMDWFEQLPIQRLDRERNDLIASARMKLAAFLGCRQQDLGFVTNASDGANAVLRSIILRAGDELITTDHAYAAVRHTLDWVAQRAGARIRIIRIDLPVTDAGQVVRDIADAINDRTRLVVMDHVTSPTALVLPVRAVAAVCGQRGVDLLVDGAHAPGMIELDLDRLGATYYTGNLHKWVGGPRGGGFLHVQPDRQARIYPTVISNYVAQGFTAAFDWQGTRDITPWLCAPIAIDEMESRWGWQEIRAHNHALALWANRMLCSAWDVPSMSAVEGMSGGMLGSMAAVWLPAAAANRFENVEALQEALYDRHRIEVPVIEHGDRRHVRVSCQVYNRPSDYQHLADAVRQITA